MNPGYNPQNQGYPPASDPNSTPPGGYPWGGAPSGSLNSVADSSPEVRANFIRSTYLLFMSGILCSIVVGTLTLSSYALTRVAFGIVTNLWLSLILILGGSFAAQAVARKPGINMVGLYGFTALIGFLFAPILRLYQPALVGQAAFLAVVVFGALSAYALISKQNFSFLGGFVFIGLSTVIVAGIANAAFFHSSGLGYWLAWGCLIFSSGWVLYDTSRMVHDYKPNENVAAALGLFISFFNIFMSILRILGGNSRD